MIKKREIKDLAYILDKVKKDPTQPKPIVLLGAGASISAGIPSANDIAKEILNQFSDKPAINRLTENERKDYYHLMSALSSDERRNIFANYINSQEVKINVTHIYLAQLLLKGYIDYVFTPNFDDLLLKACALFNTIPPVYDISNFNDFTTTNFQNQSITYLHGQHHGQWLLNAKGELEKTKDIIPKLFNKVCNRRTWIIIGYSGNDELLDELAKFESFDNELYWIGYNDQEPINRVKEKLLDIELKNAYLISGYDSDSFFLQLHSELKMETPEIFNKPFSFIQSMMKNIKDIEEYKSDDKHKEKFENVKVRFEKSKEMVQKAIINIENEIINKLQQEIIEAIVKKDFTKIDSFYKEVFQSEQDFKRIKPLLSKLYSDYATETRLNAISKSDEKLLSDCLERYKVAFELNNKNILALIEWGSSIIEIARLKSDEELYNKSIEKFKLAEKLDSRYYLTFFKWGIALLELAKLKSDEKLFIESIEKHKIATKLNPTEDSIYNNYGIALLELAILKSDERMLEKSFTAFEFAIDINPENDSAYNNWGIALYELAKQKKDEKLFIESFAKFEKTLKINPQHHSAYSKWGVVITTLAKFKSDEELFQKAFKNFKSALDLNPKDNYAPTNWAYSLLSLYHLNKDIKILNEALQKSKLAYELNSNNSYNLACCHSILNNKNEAFNYLEETLKNKSVALEHIIDDEDWHHYSDDEDFKKLIEKYT